MKAYLKFVIVISLTSNPVVSFTKRLHLIPRFHAAIASVGLQLGVWWWAKSFLGYQVCHLRRGLNVELKRMRKKVKPIRQFACVIFTTSDHSSFREYWFLFHSNLPDLVQIFLLANSNLEIYTEEILGKVVSV